jgi:hypothetical protein
MTKKANLKSSSFFICFTSMVAFSSLLISCSKKKDASNSPLFVLEQIKKEVEAGDLKTMSTHFCAADAKKFNTASGIGELILGSRGKALIDLLKRKLFESHQLNFDNIQFKNEHIDGNTATVDAYNTKKEKTRTFHFAKEADTWKMCR